MVNRTNPDLIIVPGDIPTSIDFPILLYSYIKGRSRREYIKQIYQRFDRRLSYRQIRTSKRILVELAHIGIPVLLIHGNTETNQTITWLELFTHRYPNLHWIANNAKQIGDKLFIGHGYIGVPSYYSRERSPGEIDMDEDYRKLRFTIHKAKVEYPEAEEFILVSHAPPYNTKIDYLPHKKYHAGSLNVKRVLDEGEINVVISGHLHEAHGVHRNKNWWALNAGSVVEDLACTVNLDSGEVWWYRNLVNKITLEGLLYGSRNSLNYDRKG